MPWHVAKSADCPPTKPWAVIKDADGTVEGCHASRGDAERQVAALYASEPSARGWFQITNLADGPTSVWLYDEIGSFGVTADDFVKQLGDIDADRIEMRINSPGGEVFDGMAIYNAIRRHPATVTVVVDGLAASAASFVAMAGDEVHAEPNATMMIHEAQAVAAGNSADMRKLADVLDGCSDSIAGIYAEKAGGQLADWRTRMRAETWYTAAEAHKAGLVDQVMRTPPRGGVVVRNSANWDLSTFRYPGRGAAPDPFEQPATVDTFEPAAMAVPAHETGTAQGMWDADMHKKRLPSPMSVAVARRMFAWIDASRVEDGMLPKDAGKLPHHEVSADGVPGPANLAGVRAALSRLGQANTEIPAGDVAAVRAHLRAHLGTTEDATTLAPVGESPASIDPVAFHTAMVRATKVDFDVDSFRAHMAAAVADASAPADPARPAQHLGPPLPQRPARPAESTSDLIRAAVDVAATDASAPADPAVPVPYLGPPIPERPPPQPDPSSSTGDLIRAAVSLAATDAATPPQPKTTNPADRPGFSLDALAFLAAMREAVK